MVLSVQGYFPPTNTSYPPQALFNLAISTISDGCSTIYRISSGVTDVPVIKGSVIPSLLMGFKLSFQSRSSLVAPLPLSFMLKVFLSEKVNK